MIAVITSYYSSPIPKKVSSQKHSFKFSLYAHMQTHSSCILQFCETYSYLRSNSNCTSSSPPQQSSFPIHWFQRELDMLAMQSLLKPKLTAIQFYLSLRWNSSNSAVNSFVFAEENTFSWFKWVLEKWFKNKFPGHLYYMPLSVLV